MTHARDQGTEGPREQARQGRSPHGGDVSVPSANDWLAGLLGRLDEARVAVFGDFCIDAYWLIDPDESERSVETALPVRRVRKQVYGLGGAGNVAANLADLGVGHVRAIGLIGDDIFGRVMLDLLAERSIHHKGMLRRPADEWQTMTYAKPCVGDRELNRLDFGAFNTINEAMIDALAGQVAHAAERCDVVILNQQIPAGVSTPAMIERLNAVIAEHPNCRFIVDSRHRAELYKGVMLKLNAKEASRLCGAASGEAVEPTEALSMAGRLAAMTGQPVFMTRGEAGLIVAERGESHLEPAVSVHGPVDPVGAGDTAVAAISAALAVGADCRRAAQLANLAAAVTVTKLQTTGTATPDEIRAVASHTSCRQ